MKTKIKHTTWQGRLAALALTGVTIVLPMLGTAGVAQADYYDRGYYQGRSDYGPRVVVGTVTRHLQGNYFELRTDTGRFLPVILHERGPISFGLNERVELTGYFRDGNFIADTVRFLRDDRRESYRSDYRALVKTKFNARIVAIRSARQLTVRNDYGRVYDVEAVNGFPKSVRVGDWVRVIGYANDRFMRADTIRR